MKHIFIFLSIIIVSPYGIGQENTSGWMGVKGDACISNSVQYKRTSRFAESAGDNGEWDHKFVIQNNSDQILSFNFKYSYESKSTQRITNLGPNQSTTAFQYSINKDESISASRVRVGKSVTGPYAVCNTITKKYGEGSEESKKSSHEEDSENDDEAKRIAERKAEIEKKAAAERKAKAIKREREEISERTNDAYDNFSQDLEETATRLADLEQSNATRRREVKDHIAEIDDYFDSSKKYDTDNSTITKEEEDAIFEELLHADEQRETQERRESLRKWGQERQEKVKNKGPFVDSIEKDTKVNDDNTESEYNSGYGVNEIFRDTKDVTKENSNWLESSQPSMTTSTVFSGIKDLASAGYDILDDQLSNISMASVEFKMPDNPLKGIVRELIGTSDLIDKSYSQYRRTGDFFDDILPNTIGTYASDEFFDGGAEFDYDIKEKFGSYFRDISDNLSGYPAMKFLNKISKISND